MLSEWGFFVKIRIACNEHCTQRMGGESNSAFANQNLALEEPDSATCVIVVKAVDHG